MLYWILIIMKSARRLLLIDIGSPFGGVETYVENLSALLQGQIEVFCICALPELATRLKALGVRVVCIPILFSRWSKILRFLLAFPILAYLIIRYNIGVVQVNGYLESILMMPARLLGSQTIRTAHGPSEIDRYKWYRRPEMFFPRLASRYCLNLASRVVCVSEAVSQDVLKVVPARRVAVVSNWVSAIPDHVRSRRNIASPTRILYVGRLERYKGLDLLFDAVRGLPGVRIIVVGDGEFRPELERTASGLQVAFEGFRPSISSYYDDADIFVNPSRGPEGLPMVSLEAMAYGIPCLFSDLQVHREISESGNGASLFRLGDENSLRDCLQLLLSDDNYRQTIADNARKIVSAKYSSQAALRGYLNAVEFA
jgi:glycosyltransferase involved in cell wall biosynthesis